MAKMVVSVPEETQEESSSVPERTKPFSHFERLIAWRYLRSRRREAVISVITSISFLGIMLGVATLIVVMAVMNGFRGELLTRMLGVNGHLIVEPVDMPFRDYDAVASRIAQISGVRLAAPIVQGQALASGPGTANSGAVIRGIPAESLLKMDLIARNIRQGSLVAFSAGHGVVVGSRMAQTLALSVGDSITLLSPEGDITPFGAAPRKKSYTVSAIFEVGMSEYDSTIIYLPMQEAQLFLNRENLAQTIEVFIKNPDDVGKLLFSVEQAARRPVVVSDWRQRDQAFFSALQVERNVMFVILTMIVLVAALNIISGMTMLVKEKGHDIAILRTMGATRGAIMRIFLMAGAAIGTTGTLAGFMLGTLICLNVESLRQFFTWLSGTTIFNPEIYFLSQLPADMQTGETLSIVLMAFSLSLLATLFPAWRASRLDPVEALRYE